MSLDIEERQVVLYYEDDNVPWHQRVLLIHLDAARWLAATPAYEVQVLDLAGQTFRALARGSPVPAECAPSYLFDKPIPSADLNRIRAEARRTAEVLGVPQSQLTVAGSIDAVWLFSDPAHEQFGEPVPDAILGDTAMMVIRGSVGLDCYETEWAHAEHVATGDKTDWLMAKRTGPGRDPRRDLAWSFFGSEGQIAG